jgi:hypothetical protein
MSFSFFDHLLAHGDHKLGFLREAENKFDTNAILVLDESGACMGYLPKAVAGTFMDA